MQEKKQDDQDGLNENKAEIITGLKGWKHVRHYTNNTYDNDTIGTDGYKLNIADINFETELSDDVTIPWAKKMNNFNEYLFVLDNFEENIDETFQKWLIFDANIINNFNNLPGDTANKTKEVEIKYIPRNIYDELVMNSIIN